MKAGEGKIPRISIPSLGWQALKWNYLGNIMRSLSQFVIGILLARLLGPEPFGIVAVAWMILGVGNLFADLGFGSALVQRENLTPLDLRFIFTCQMAFASLLTAAGVLGAEYIAEYFHKPEATLVIQVMFLLFVLQAVGQTGAAVLRRSLNFKALQQITVTSYLVGYLLIGIPAAYLGWGVWSLVAAQLVQSALSSILFIRITSVPITPYFRRGSRDIVTFGLKVTAANFSSWSISNLDTVFIGRAFGVVELGLYNRALNLLSTPMNVITNGFQGVLFASCSRTQNDPERIRRIHLETTSAVAMICFPVFVTAAVVPETIVLGIYGSKWHEAIQVVTPLSLAVLVNALLAIKGPILMAGNRVGVELKNQLYTIVLFLPMLFFAVQYSLLAVAWAVFATYVIRWILLTVDTLRFTGATFVEYAKTLGMPLLFCIAVSTSAAVADSLLAFLPPFSRLAAVAMVSGIALLIMLRLRGGHFVAENLKTLVDVKNLPGIVRKFLNV